MKTKYSHIYDFCAYKGFKTWLVKFSFPRYHLDLYKTKDWSDTRVQRFSLFAPHVWGEDDFFEYIKECLWQ